MKIFLWLSLFSLLAEGCKNPQEKPPTETSVSKEKIYEREPADSARYTHIKYTLYADTTGNLYERKLIRCIDDCESEFIVSYDSSFLIWTEDTCYPVSLKSILDMASFVEVGSTQYSKDKNRVYYFHATSDGGVRLIVAGADPTSFRQLSDYRWGIDKNKVFFKENPLPDIDLKTLVVLYPPDSSDSPDYIKDKTKVYYEDNPVKEAHAPTFRTVAAKEWDAEDRSRKYRYGSIYQK